MREKIQKQILLPGSSSGHIREKELEMISDIIDNTPHVLERVLADLNKGKVLKSNKGANGMSADQVLRSFVVFQLFELSFSELEFTVADSRSCRNFCRIDGKEFKKSALHANIKKLSAETLESISRDLLGYAVEAGIEKGREVRIDCTVTESNIHKPSDAVLLWDCVRVLTRLIENAKNGFNIKKAFNDHQRRARRRMLGIENARNEKQRRRQYVDLLKVTRKVLGYAKETVGIMSKMSRVINGFNELSTEIKHYMDLTERVISQTERRVINGEQVPASEKVVSIFEEHTDIIKKDKRETYFGHKICLTGGASNLILDCKILEGNPADSTLVEMMLDRQAQVYGRYPLKVSMDGGFASKENLKKAKERGIKDVCFAKKRGLEVTDMCRSEHVYRKLRRFRAGIESGISWLKRRFGLDRCTWKGFESFKSYVLSSVIAANLLTMARKKLAMASA